MLAVWRKPPGEEPEGSRPSATSLVVHVVLSKATQHRRSGPLLVAVVPLTTRSVSKPQLASRRVSKTQLITRSVSKAPATPQRKQGLITSPPPQQPELSHEREQARRETR